MYCLNCGSKLEDDSRFCSNCGQPMEPVAPVAQETIIVPQIPDSGIAEDKPMDQPTIIIPEVPDLPVQPEMPADPLTEYFPEPPKKKSKTGLIIGLIAGGVLLIALTVILCWFLFSGDGETEKDSDEKTTTTAAEEPAGDDEPTAEELRAGLEEYTLNGLTFYLSDVFEETSRDEFTVEFDAPEMDSIAMVTVSFGMTSEIEGENVTTSEDLAQYLAENLSPDAQVGQRHGVSYVTLVDGDYSNIWGCYVMNGCYWMIKCDAYPMQDVFIDYATLGLIDEDFTPPQEEPAPDPEEYSCSGLYLTLDSSFEETSSDQESVILSNENVTIYVAMDLMTAFPEVSSSKDFAEFYQELHADGDWDQLEIQDAGNGFYYVLMSSDGWTTVTGLYTYGDWGWTVTGETKEFDKYGEALIQYISSGRIEPEEVPVVEVAPDVIEINGLKLPLEGYYREVYRDNSYVFLSGNMDVYIFSGPTADMDPFYASASEMASAEQQMYSDYWDNVQLHNVDGVDCLLMWDDAYDTAATAYGYYMAGGNWWLIQVNGNSASDGDAMLAIAAAGQVDAAVEDTPPVTGELVSRDRITMSGQLTADYEGLQVSYSPDWTADTTWGPTGDYVGENFEMYSYCYSLSTQGVTDAVSFAWKLAEEWQGLWEHYEVGMAGGVPYVLMYDEDSEYFLVMGTYANDQTCWEIDVHCYDSSLLDEAIWYATAGQITEDISET